MKLVILVFWTCNAAALPFGRVVQLHEGSLVRLDEEPHGHSGHNFVAAWSIVGDAEIQSSSGAHL